MIISGITFILPFDTLWVRYNWWGHTFY